MKKKTSYSKAPEDIALAITQSERIADFLPAPEKLLKKENSVKVTVSLSKDSINFLKNKAKKSNGSYQQMLRKIIDLYVSYYKQAH